MKFSNEEKSLAHFIFSHRNIIEDKGTNKEILDYNIKKIKFLLVDNAKDLKIKQNIKELLKYLNKLEYMQYIENWNIPIFPVTGDMLVNKNIPKGPVYSIIMEKLRDQWKNDFNLDTSNETKKKLEMSIDTFINN
jgi:hypothetical protein